MKKRLLTLAAFGALCVAGLTSCAEQIPTVHYSALTVTKDEGVASVDIARADGESGLDLTSVLEGTELVATVAINDWYVVDSISFDGQELAYTVGQTEFEFFMPTYDCSFEVKTLRQSQITVTNNVNDGTVTLSNVTDSGVTESEDGIFVYGETARIEAEAADEDRKVVGLVINGEEIEWDGSAHDIEVGEETYALEVIYAYRVTSKRYMNALGSNTITDVEFSVGDTTYEDGDFVKQGSNLTVTYTVGSSTSGTYEDSYSSFYLYQNDEGKHATESNYVKTENEHDKIVDSVVLSEPTTFAIEFNYGYAGTNGFALVAGDIQHAKIYGLLEGDTFSGTTYFTIVREKGYTYSISFAHPETGSAINFTCYTPNFNGSEMARITIYGVTADAVMNITATEAKAHDITYVGRDGVQVDDPTYLMGNYAVEGESVNMYGLSSASEDNSISGISITGGAVYPYTYSSGGYYQYSFTMGTSDVNISFSYVDNIEVTVNEDERVTYTDVRSGSYLSSPVVTKVAPGSTVYVFALAEQGYAITGGTANEGTVSSYNTSSTRDYNNNINYTVVAFNIPSTATEFVVTLTVVQLRNITIEGYDTTHFSSSYSFSVNGVNGGVASQAAPGASVRYSISLAYAYQNSHYVVIELVAEGHANQTLTTTRSYSASGSFEMPDYDVTFKVSIVEYDKITVSATITGEVGQLTSYSFTGVAGNAVTGTSYTGALSLDVYVGRQLSASIGVNAGYKVTCTYTVFGTTQTLTASNIYNNQYNYTVPQIPQGLTAVEFKIELNTPLNVHVVNNTEDNLTLTWTVNGSTVQSTGIYAGNYVQVSVNEAAPDGYSYRLTLTDTSSGAVINTGYTSVYATVTGDFTVTIDKIAAFTVSLVLEPLTTGGFDGNLQFQLFDRYYNTPINYNRGVTSYSTTAPFEAYIFCDYTGNNLIDIIVTIDGVVSEEYSQYDTDYYQYSDPVTYEYHYINFSKNTTITVKEHAA